MASVRLMDPLRSRPMLTLSSRATWPLIALSMAGRELKKLWFRAMSEISLIDSNPLGFTSLTLPRELNVLAAKELFLSPSPVVEAIDDTSCLSCLQPC
ncbi:hypothetical protein BDZ91DRAFT_712733 [Kalaharituber pfeilii]|nr:hypothetical protein BDZ91DRAFT_712733 [Kalaharituber pfeilii]